MKTKGLWILVSLVVVLGLLMVSFGCQSTASPTTTSTTTASPSPTQAQVIKWNMQSAYPLTSNWTIMYGIDWAKWVETMTNGRLKISFFPPGTFAAGGEMLDAVGKGTIDVALDYSGYHAGRIPEINPITQLPMGYLGLEDLWNAAYNYGLMDKLRAAYAKHNVYAVSVNTLLGNINFGVNWDFKGIDDFKGKKIRAAGAFARYVEVLGGSPSNIDAGELYNALKTGIIDGLQFATDTLKTYKFAEVVKGWIVQPVFDNSTQVTPTINMDKWNALPGDIKTIINEGTKYFYLGSAVRYRLSAAASEQWAVQNYGTKLIKLSEADTAKCLQAAFTVWDEVAKASPEAAAIVAIQKQRVKDEGRVK